MAKSGYVWDGSAWVPFTAPVGAVPNAVSAYSSVAPSNPQIGQMWVDVNFNPGLIKVYNGSAWVTVSTPVPSADDDQNILANQVFR